MVNGNSHLDKLSGPIKESYRSTKKQIGESFKQGPVYLAKDYVAATLGSLIPSFPFLAGFELLTSKLVPFLEILDTSSFKEMMMKFFLIGLVTAYPVSKIRKGTRHGFKADVNDGGSINEKILIHDSIFQAVGNSLFNIGVYANLSYGAVRSVGNLVSGVLDGIGLDLFDVLLGTGDSKRIPDFIKNLNQNSKEMCCESLIFIILTSVVKA